MKVLIVEDDRPMRALIKKAISPLAVEVIESSDGSEAVALYAEHRPDCVLMDISLNDVDGLTAAREITTAWPGARVIIVTGYDGARLREAARQAGARAYVLKDNLSELLRLLKDARA